LVCSFSLASIADVMSILEGSKDFFRCFLLAGAKSALSIVAVNKIQALGPSGPNPQRVVWSPSLRPNPRYKDRDRNVGLQTSLVRLDT